MSIRWENINTFQNSQNSAFEELVCQLAREEDIDEKKEFYRIAAPDGGVEAYCTLNNGDEYGWQAKYFSSMGRSQWNQLEESFKTALRTHSNLKKYYICIPLDRQDPRRDSQKWFMDKWIEHVQKWKDYAASEGRDISFEYWGSSELIHRFSMEKHAGRKLFWFSQEEFSDNWFKEQVETSIFNLGKRYTPELNVKLEIAKNFDSISRNSSFRQFTKNEFHSFLVKINKILNLSHNFPFENQLAQIKKAVVSIESIFSDTQKEEITNIEIESLEKYTNTIGNNLSGFEKYFRVKREDNEKNKNNDDYSIRVIYDAQNALYEFADFIHSSTLKLSNKPILILTGPAGIGKSHLLADVALNKLHNHKSCILLLGQHFTSDETPWSQILHKLLRLNCNEKHFLGALNAKAESQRERILFLIDAINEGRGKYFWPEHIMGFVKEVEKYPWIGLVMSIRSSYRQLLIPEELNASNIAVEIEHTGFANIEYKASNFFFSQYSIEPPGVPLLHPEFSNPLFLKLFCEGLYQSGLTKIPKGYRGITNIIDTFIKSIECKLSKPTSFDYPIGQNVIKKVICDLIKYKLDNDLWYTPYEIAFDIADQILSRYSNKRRFLDALISEGVLSKNLFWQENGKDEEGVYFAYERFEDHLITSYLLDGFLTKENMDTIFKPGGTLNKYIRGTYSFQGILESLSIQIPEKMGKELYELLDEEQKSHRSIKEAFINSLLWRKVETIQEYTKEYVNKHILPEKYTRKLFFQMVYSVSYIPGHFYNADSLHRFLMQFSLPDRDALWTTYLHNHYPEEDATDRLIVWAKSNDDKSHLDNCSRLLAAKALSWIFTSTNIPFRDSATKALVVLLENNVQTMEKLLKEFKDVNDPYVYERIFAAIYGAVLRSDCLDSLGNLSGYIIKIIFSQDEVYPHILVRDYARNIVEFALYKGCFELDDACIIRPPYKSSFPNSFPTNDEVDSYKLDYQDNDFKDYHWGQNAILNSMVTEYGRGMCSYGDFGRYTFQSKLHAWGQFDPNDLSNYACKLIFEKYGYDVEKHGQFDREASNSSRRENITERIGKKYQWLALYEVLARISDNFPMIDEATRWSDDKQYVWYDGPWNPFVRNIDPTIVHHEPKEMPEDFLPVGNISYNDWGESEENWLIKTENLPDPKITLSLTDSENNEWLILKNYITWEEPVPVGIDKYDYPQKHLCYGIKSFLVKNEDGNKLFDWLKGKNLVGQAIIPDIRDQYQVFGREYYWSPTYNFFHNNPYYGRTLWEEVPERFSQGNAIAKVMMTTERHIWESGANYDQEPSYLAPRKYIFSAMKMQYSKNIGEWLDEHGEIACLDPSVNRGGKSALMIRKNIFLNFLTENNLKLFWICEGDKSILGNFFRGDYPKKRLELSGVYVLNEGNIEGNTEFYK